MENVNKIEIMMVLIPAIIYWFYILYLMLTDASPHPKIKITMRHKVIAPLAVLGPLAVILLPSASMSAESFKTALGLFALPATYITLVLMACAPIAAIYILILLIRQFNAWTPGPVRPKYKINSTGDCILAMNAATSFMRDRQFEEEQEQLDREFEEAQRRSDEEEKRKNQFTVDLTSGLYN